MRTEIFPDSCLEINPDNPMLKALRPCKAIYPRDANDPGAKNFSYDNPRLVRTGFRVPANWTVKEEKQNGDPILDAQGQKIYQESMGVSQFLIHVCRKPHNRLSDKAGGYYAELIPSTNEIRQAMFEFLESGVPMGEVHEKLQHKFRSEADDRVYPAKGQ
jgi:hypothetical protein